MAWNLGEVQRRGYERYPDPYGTTDSRGDPVTTKALLSQAGFPNGVTLNYVGPSASQFLVRRGTWMGASTLGDWTLLSCWCAPAFRPEHFELGARDVLVERYPSYAAEIRALTRDEPIGRMR